MLARAGPARDGACGPIGTNTADEPAFRSARLQAGATPKTAGYFQIVCNACDTTSPSSSSVAAQMNAETKLANWNRQNGISKMPATSGTEARNGPEKRAMKIPSTPHFVMKASPFGMSSGWLDTSSPSSSSVAAQMNAETKLANWN